MRMHGKGWHAFMLPLLVGALSQSCVSDPHIDNGKKEDLNNKPESEYFGFETTKSISLDLNYGPYAANALLSVYVSNPVGENNDEIVGEPAFRIFADKDGCYRGTADIPSYTGDVWVQVSAFGVPAITKASAENGVVRIDINNMYDTAKAPFISTKSSDTEYEWHKAYVDADPGFRIFSYIDWATDNNTHGQINYDKYSNLFTAGKLTPEEVIAIRNVLWQGNTSKPAANGPDRLDNSYLRKFDTELVNTNLGGTYQDADGTIKTVKSAKVFMTFLHEAAEYQNTLGYYYYKTGDVPGGGLREVDKYVVIPNVSSSDNAPYYANGSAPLQPYGVNGAKNLRTQLLFLDPEDGKLKEEFPAGYTIGYFIVPRGWEDGRKAIVVNGKWGIYSNCEPNWNNLTVDVDWANLTKLRKGFISLRLPNGSLLYGVEDSYVDLSYEDILFTIDTEPSYAIKQDERPTLVPTNSEGFSTETTYHTYCFEDIWPYGGDYDLNDVMIQHKREVMFGNVDNDVVKIVDTFTPVQPAGSASYINAFAVQFGLNESLIEKTEFSNGMIYEDDTKSVIVTEDAAADRGKSFTITRTFKSGLSKKKVAEDMNPFIIANYKKNAKTRTEVHLPKHKATSRCDSKLKNTGKDAYYIDRDGEFPFAISLPVRDFEPAPESVRIDKVYTKYSKWATSKGMDCEDWFLKK